MTAEWGAKKRKHVTGADVSIILCSNRSILQKSTHSVWGMTGSGNCTLKTVNKTYVTACFVLIQNLFLNNL